jgi:hypothetical protein
MAQQQQFIGRHRGGIGEGAAYAVNLMLPGRHNF